MNQREQQKEKRRMQLLEIGLDQFIKKGFYGTSTREIAKIAGISSGLMFHYFPSKENLYESLIKIGCGKMEAWAENEITDPLGALQQQLNMVWDNMFTKEFSCKMFVFIGYAQYNAKDISDDAAALLANHDVITQTIPIFEAGQKLGVFKDGDPLALSIAFWTPVQGIAEAIALVPNRPLPNREWILDIVRKDK